MSKESPSLFGLSKTNRDFSKKDSRKKGSSLALCKIPFFSLPPSQEKITEVRVNASKLSSSS